MDGKYVGKQNVIEITVTSRATKAEIHRSALLTILCNVKKKIRERTFLFIIIIN
jgi:hypothetical protein